MRFASTASATASTSTTTPASSTTARLTSAGSSTATAPSAARSSARATWALLVGTRGAGSLQLVHVGGSTPSGTAPRAHCHASRAAARGDAAALRSSPRARNPISVAITATSAVCQSSGVVITRSAAATASASTSSPNCRFTTNRPTSTASTTTPDAATTVHAARDRTRRRGGERDPGDEEHHRRDREHGDGTLHAVDEVPRERELRALEQRDLELAPARELGGEVGRDRLERPLHEPVGVGQVEHHVARAPVDEHRVRARQRLVEHGPERRALDHPADDRREEGLRDPEVGPGFP